MRIFFPITFDLCRLWRGGFNLVHGVLHALPSDKVSIELVYVYPGIPAQESLEKIATSTHFKNPDEAVDYLNETSNHGRNPCVMFSLGHCGLWHSDIRRIVYVPDFQHEYLPQNFSQEELQERRLGFQIETATADGVWVSSQPVEQDLDKFLVNTPAKRLVLHFPSFRTAWPEADKPLGLPAQYLLCISQGWPHKNLERLCNAWRALGEARGERALVIAGRGIAIAPDASIGLYILPDITDGTLGELYRNAEVFVLPSQFEGWSTPVEEAISFSLPLLLSDIPVLREHAPYGAGFFNPNSREDIEIALRAWCTDSGYRSQLSTEVKQISRITPSEYGQQLLKYFEEVVCAS